MGELTYSEKWVSKQDTSSTLEEIHRIKVRLFESGSNTIYEWHGAIFQSRRLRQKSSSASNQTEVQWHSTSTPIVPVHVQDYTSYVSRTIASVDLQSF